VCPACTQAYNSSGGLATTIPTVANSFMDQAPWPHSFAKFTGRRVEVSDSVGRGNQQLSSHYHPQLQATRCKHVWKTAAQHPVAPHSCSHAGIWLLVLPLLQVVLGSPDSTGCKAFNSTKVKGKLVLVPSDGRCSFDVV
jgi:hypothetical protein